MSSRSGLTRRCQHPEVVEITRLCDPMARRMCQVCGVELPPVRRDTVDVVSTDA